VDGVALEIAHSAKVEAAGDLVASSIIHEFLLAIATEAG
jgi:hypothetical protein